MVQLQTFEIQNIQVFGIDKTMTQNWWKIKLRIKLFFTPRGLLDKKQEKLQ